MGTFSSELRTPVGHPDGVVFINDFVRSVARWPHQIQEHLDWAHRYTTLSTEVTVLIMAACLHPEAFPPEVLPAAVTEASEDAWLAFRWLTRDGEVTALQRLAHVFWPQPSQMHQALEVGAWRSLSHVRTQAMAYWPRLAGLPGGRAWLEQVSTAYEGEYPELAHALRHPIQAQERQTHLAAMPAAQIPRIRRRA